MSDNRLARQQPLLTGELCFEHLACGLRIHCTDIIEQQSGKTSSEVEAGVSINFLLAGEVNYDLGERQYQFNAGRKPIAFASILHDKEIFTRRFRQGARVRKFNILVAKSWLLKRCKTSADSIAIGRLFSAVQSVYQLAFSDDDLALVEQLFRYQNKQDMTSRLMAEHLTFQLFTQCYQQLTAGLNTSVAPFSLSCEQSW